MAPIPRRRLSALLLAGAMALAACGEDGETSGADRFADADPEAVEVIDGWTRTLAEGDVEGAAGYFAIPSVAANGSQVIRIESPADAVLFNRSLPCGAVLVDAVSRGDFTTATFELTERPGPGECGAGVGETAKTSFQVADGKITEWRRVGLGPAPAPGPTV